MRSTGLILALTAVLLIGVAMPLAAADERALSTDKTSVSGFSVVRYDGIAYRIFTQETVAVSFGTVDDVRVMLTVKPVSITQPTMMCEVSVQWGFFPPIVLSIDGGGGSSFILNTETGYAEK